MRYIKLTLSLLLIFAFCKCDNSKDFEISREFRHCLNQKSIFDTLIAKANNDEFKDSLPINYEKVQDFVKNYKIENNCLKELNFIDIEFVFVDGLNRGLLINIDNSYMIYYSLNQYNLSPRYQIIKKMSEYFYIVKYFG